MEYRMNYCEGKCIESLFVPDGLLLLVWKRGFEHEIKRGLSFLVWNEEL